MKIKTNTVLIAVALAVLLALLGALGFIVYQSYAYKADIAAMQSAARDASALAARQAALERNLKGSKADLDAVDARFVREGEVSDFVDMLEKTADAQGVNANIGSLSLEPNARDGGIKALTLRVDGTGTWNQVLGFMAALESMPYALRVNVASLQKVLGDGAPGGVWRFAADLRQYVSI
jgi:Tfp pilus assembly protein PilO